MSSSSINISDLPALPGGSRAHTGVVAQGCSRFDVGLRVPSEPACSEGGAVRLAIELMASDLTSNFGIVELAAMCNLSVRHFQREFRHRTGLPPHQWRILQRVERAKELLKETTHPLVDVALACGFADQSHFTRSFSKDVGVSPSLYRHASLLA